MMMMIVLTRYLPSARYYAKCSLQTTSSSPLNNPIIPILQRRKLRLSDLMVIKWNVEITFHFVTNHPKTPGLKQQYI